MRPSSNARHPEEIPRQVGEVGFTAHWDVAVGDIMTECLKCLHNIRVTGVYNAIIDTFVITI